MIKKFRRSAAGYEEQLPSDIRTPTTLQSTLNYLLDHIVKDTKTLASVHKFVWDRTRGIRNDFSIQQLTHRDHVTIAVDCLERIARFHILSLHQLSDLKHSEADFSHQQEREQLNNTLLSLIYYYDDHRGRIDFKNEAEFRAYCIIFEIQSQRPDLETRIQFWPPKVLGDERVQTALKLYAAAGNTRDAQGPLQPRTQFLIAQSNYGSFWSLLKSKAVSYLMACVAEIYFNPIRHAALQAIWKAYKRTPPTQQHKNEDWTPSELVKVLGFDARRQATWFCKELGLGFKKNAQGVLHLDWGNRSEATLKGTHS